VALAHSLFQSSQDIARGWKDRNHSSKFNLDQLTMVQEQIITQQRLRIDSLHTIWKMAQFQIELDL